MNYNLQEILNILKPYYRKDYKIIRYNHVFDPDSFYVFFKDMMDIADKLKDFRIVVSLCRRNGLLVILQEKYYKLTSYSEADIDIEKIEILAKERFKFTNRDKSKFNHPEVIHPKNPFQYYGNDIHSLNHYRAALEHLLAFPKIYIYDDEAISHLVKLYDRIKS